jgi:hypothetical protein
MKLRVFSPCVLSKSKYQPKPRILPFPGRQCSGPQKTAQPGPDDRAADLSEVRDRLFRMIVANQSDRSHGNRAS